MDSYPKTMITRTLYANSVRNTNYNIENISASDSKAKEGTFIVTSALNNTFSILSLLTYVKTIQNQLQS